MEKVKFVMRTSLEYLKPKRKLPEPVFKAYQEANARYPQTSEGIFIEVLHAFVHLNDFDFTEIRKYGLDKAQYKILERKMFSIHDSIKIERDLKKKLRMKLFLRAISTILLNSMIINGISRFIHDYPDNGIERLKSFSEKLQLILKSELNQKLAKERWQLIKDKLSNHRNDPAADRFSHQVGQDVTNTLSSEEIKYIKKLLYSSFSGCTYRI